jgi:hypothetical protein
MFRFTQEPSSGSHFLCLAKTTVMIVCIIVENKKCFDTVDARCKHEDEFLCLTGDTLQQYFNPVYHISIRGHSSILRSHSVFVNSHNFDEKRPPKLNKNVICKRNGMCF